MKLIIDCDPGVDDIYALAVAAVVQNAEILAITTVNGNTTIDYCSINAKLTVDILFPKDKKPPVYIGASKSLTTLPEPVFYYFGRDGIGGTSKDFLKKETDSLRQSFYETYKEKCELHAALKILELVNKYPNEITLIAIGPLTNLALALKLSNDPLKFTQNIQKLIIMGGSEPKGFTDLENYHGVNFPEFNFRVDPIAAHLVITQFKCPQVIYTFDCCIRSLSVPTLMLNGEFEKHASSNRCSFLKEIGFRHEEQRNLLPTGPIKKTHFYSCDLVTMIGVFHEDECSTLTKRSTKYFDVEINCDKLNGLLIEVDSPQSNQDIQLVVKMDDTKVYSIFKEYLKKLANLD